MNPHAILFTAPHTVELAPTTIPALEAGEVLIETAYSAISPGTELRCLAGLQPDAAPWPFVPGYALTGRITQRGPDTQLPIGTPVYCRGSQRLAHGRMWGGHISHAIAAESSVFVLPADADLRLCALGSLAAIALHGVRLSKPQIDERVAVIGLGPIGQLSARLHALSGAQVVAADPIAERVALLHGTGVTGLPGGADLAATFAPVFPDGADVVVDATGAPQIVPHAVKLARDVPWGDGPAGGARLLIQGSYPDTFSLPYQAVFRKELQILVPRDLQPRDLRRALALIHSGALRVADLISKTWHPQDAPEAYVTLRGAMTYVFDWQS